AIIAAGVDPIQNGIALFEALAEPQYDDLSRQTLIQLLLVYARQAGTSGSVPQDVGTAIASLVPATLSATQAVSYVAAAAGEVALSGNTASAVTTGQVLGTVLAQLQGVLGSDPIAAAIQSGVLSPNLGQSWALLEGLGVSNAASVVAGYKDLLGA